MKFATNKEIENQKAGFDPMICNLAGGKREEDWWNAEWPTLEESAQPTTDLDFAGKGKADAKGKGKGNTMQLGGKGVLNPMQMMMAAISAMKGGGTGQQLQQQQRWNERSKWRNGFWQGMLQLWQQPPTQGLPTPKERDGEAPWFLAVIAP